MYRLRARLLRLLPTRSLSRLLGRAARLPVPNPLRPLLWRSFAKAAGIDLGEIEEPLAAYPNLLSFFTRRLVQGSRPVDGAPDAVVSPVDGRVVSAGPLALCPELEVKGARYRPAELLGDAADALGLVGGSQLTLYLSPADYHRIHAPFSAAVERWRHLPGRLLPVNPPTLAAVDRLYPGNERVISLWADREHGRSLWMVLVGALNVGSIRVLWDPALATNRRDSTPGERRADAPRRFRAGEEAARFELGSSVVLLAGPGAWEGLSLLPGQRVLQGQQVARWSSSQVEPGAES